MGRSPRRHPVQGAAPPPSRWLPRDRPARRRRAGRRAPRAGRHPGRTASRRLFGGGFLLHGALVGGRPVLGRAAGSLLGEVVGGTTRHLPGNSDDRLHQRQCMVDPTCSASPAARWVAAASSAWSWQSARARRETTRAARASEVPAPGSSSSTARAWPAQSARSARSNRSARSARSRGDVVPVNRRMAVHRRSSAGGTSSRSAAMASRRGESSAAICSAVIIDAWPIEASAAGSRRRNAASASSASPVHSTPHAAPASHAVITSCSGTSMAGSASPPSAEASDVIRSGRRWRRRGSPGRAWPLMQREV